MRARASSGEAKCTLLTLPRRSPVGHALGRLDFVCSDCLVSYLRRSHQSREGTTSTGQRASRDTRWSTLRKRKGGHRRWLRPSTTRSA